MPRTMTTGHQCGQQSVQMPSNTTPVLLQIIVNGLADDILADDTVQ